MKKTILFLLILVSNCFAQYVPQFNREPSVGYQINLGHPVAQGLIVMWLFNENLGSKAYDLSPYNNDATLITMQEDDWVIGPTGIALDFDGSSDYLYTGANSGSTFPPTGDFTYSAWFKLDDASDEMLFMINQDNQFDAFISGNDIRINIDSITRAITTDNWITTGVWHHFVVTRTGSAIVIYGNSVSKATGSYGNAVIISTCGLLIGTDADTGCEGSLGNYLDGQVDNIAIWDRGLYTYEVELIFNNRDLSFLFEQPPGRILTVAVAAAAVDRRRFIITNP